MDSFLGPHTAILNCNCRRELWNAPEIAKNAIVVEGRGFLLCVVTVSTVSPFVLDPHHIVHSFCCIIFFSCSFMETNKFGERLGEVFGTVCWLWVFHRFSQDGKVLLGMEHPWEHGGGHGHDSHGHGPSHGHHGKEKKLSPDELAGEWEKFTEKATRPGDDDDDDEEDEEVS
jgi:hypothetical protein